MSKHLPALVGLLLLVGLALTGTMLATPAAVGRTEAPAGGRPATGPHAGSACAPTWTIVPSTNPHIHNHLLAVEPLAAANVWAVGYYYESTGGQAPDTALIMHWDGTQWSEYALPSAIVGRLNGISAISATDIWAVGWTNGDPNPDTNTLTLHWNGTAWSRVASPTVEGISELNDVAAIAADNVWAVGAVNGTHGTLVEHWNGATWSIVPSPPQSFGDNYILTEVAAVAPADIWAVGLIDQGSGFQRTLTEHWDGATWSIVPSPDPGGYYSRLDGVVALAADNVWAAGSYSTATGSDPPRTLIEHWNGTAWTVVASPSPGLFFNALEDVTALAADDLWAVGLASDDLQLPDYTVVVHWDGATWSVEPSPNGPRRDNNLWGVAARAGLVWAVGKGEDKYDNNQPWDTLVLRASCPPSPTVTGTPPTATRTTVPLPSATATPCSLASTNYSITASAGATVVPAGADVGLHCDDCATTVGLPFPFALYGQPFSQVIVGSNGTLGFVGNSNSANTTCLPSQEFNYGILAYWQDLHLSNLGGGCPGCGIFTAVEGSAPNRIFAIEWRAQDYFYTSPVNVEVRLYETTATSQFDVIYGQVPSGTNQQVTVGVQKAQGALLTQFVCENQAPALSNGMKLVFAQPPCAGTPTPGTATPAPSSPTPLGPSATATPVPATRTPGPTLTVPACAIAFSDVPPSNPFYVYIRCLVCRGVVSGYSDRTFRPGNPITRGQTTKLVANAAGIQDAVPSTQQTFSDVPPGDPFWLYIERLAAPSRGYISGYACGVAPAGPCDARQRPWFLAGNAVTRGQIAKIVANAAGLNNGVPSTQQTFSDVPVTNAFWVYIERLAPLNVISGYTCGSPPAGACDPQQRPYFLPFTGATRGQTAKIVANTFFPACQTP
ncbi:MAG TPA: S-layer homology domain-containing protein [Chloroflexia bacterium]|nr:S-layer homology domain-containing protein [Chloroflexia bacterium]